MRALVIVLIVLAVAAWAGLMTAWWNMRHQGKNPPTVLVGWLYVFNALALIAVTVFVAVWVSSVLDLTE